MNNQEFIALQADLEAAAAHIAKAARTLSFIKEQNIRLKEIEKTKSLATNDKEFYRDSYLPRQNPYLSKQYYDSKNYY